MKTLAISTGISTAKSSAKISSAKQLNSEIEFKDIFSKTGKSLKILQWNFSINCLGFEEKRKSSRLMFRCNIMPVAYKTIWVTKSIWNLIHHIVALFVRALRPSSGQSLWWYTHIKCIIYLESNNSLP